MSVKITPVWIEYQATGGCTFAAYLCTADGREFVGHYELGAIDADGQWRGDAEDDLRAAMCMDRNRDWSVLPMQEVI